MNRNCQDPLKVVGRAKGYSRKELINSLPRHAKFTPNLLQQINLSSGGRINYRYTPSTRFDNTFMPMVKQVVTNLWIDDRVFAPNSQKSYQIAYKGGLYNASDHEFRGFRYVKQIDQDANIKEIWFNQTKQLAGSIDQLTLSNISANWEGPGESDLKVNGGIDNVAELEGIQLQLDGKLDKPDWLKPLLPDSMATLNSADLSAGISGAYKQLGIRAFKLQAKTEDELDLLLNGQFDVASQSAGMQPENIDLALTFSAPTTHAARGLLFEQVPELGAINGKTNVHAVTGAPALKDILIKR